MLGFRNRISGVVPSLTLVGRMATGFGLAILAIHWALIVRFLAVRAGSLSFLRLHYSVAFGVDWVDSWWFIFVYPLMGLAVFAVNLRLAISLSRVRPEIGTMMMISASLLQALFAAGGSFAILLNS